MAYRLTNDYGCDHRVGFTGVGDREQSFLRPPRSSVAPPMRECINPFCSSRISALGTELTVTERSVRCRFVGPINFVGDAQTVGIVVANAHGEQH